MDKLSLLREVLKRLLESLSRLSEAVMRLLERLSRLSEAIAGETLSFERGSEELC